jgi:Trk K+ transport system NAD-binding subunit
MHQPVILCGLGRVGWRVLDYLQVAGLPVVVIDTQCRPDDPRLKGARLIQGDCRQQAILEQAGLAQARGVLVLTGDDLVNVSATLTIRHCHASIRIVVRMFNPTLLGRLGKAVANVYALSVSALTAPLLALTALTGQSLGTFGSGADTRQVAEVMVTEGSPLAGHSIAELAERYRFVALAHGRGTGQQRYLLEVDPDTRLQAGDRLALCGAPVDLAPLLVPEAGDILPHLRWAGKLRRAARIVGRTFAEIELPVKLCTLILLAVLVASTLVYYFGVEKSLPDGLYRTVSVISTGADMHESELKSGWQKVFVSFLRIFGAALTAAFTAIVTNYLIRARLGKALEIRRIPDSGHVVVCGLGSVGFRVVEELLQHDERVVAIERAADGRFLATARRLGVAVIVGDATVAEVLRQAHAATARAVLAVTNNELVNLEIALLVREENPQQRVVLRMADAHLAQTLREAANVRLALSTSALAAPAFVAALFGDRVQNIFLVGGRVLAAVELLVQADDALLSGQTVRALSVDYQLLPVTLMAADGVPRSRLLDHRLAAGDRLTGIAALGDLARLLRRERVTANWAVRVKDFLIPARAWVSQLVQGQRGLGPEDVERLLERLPFDLAVGITHGQAADLVALCQRERVTAEARTIDDQA